jgi:hypothetical protein
MDAVRMYDHRVRLDIRMRVASILGLLLLLAACRSVFDEEVRLRKERLELESRMGPRDPIYVERFGDYLKDRRASMPADIYHHVLGWLERLSDKEVRGRIDKSVRYSDLVDEPAECRGKFVRLQGYIYTIWTEEVAARGFEGDRIYAAILFVKNRDPLLVHWIEKPPLVYLKEDLVSVDGIFLKVFRYELKDGGVMEAPLVVGRRLLKYD